MASKTSQLQVALEASCRRAWEGWSKKYPDERFYAFALYTTMDADYFVPSISGENGLAKVARQYVKRKSFATIDEAKSQLRWSFADSPYHNQGERYNKGVDEELDAAPIPYEKSERAADKVIKARFDTAVAALQSLDRQGTFGKGAKRKKIILLIEAGDRDQEWALKLAKRLNPKDVYSTYAKQFQPRIIGKFKELGSKQVYTVNRLSATADRRYLLAAAEYEVFLFDIAKKKQLWTRKVQRGEDLAVQSAALSADGSTVVVAWASQGSERAYGLAIWSGKDFKQVSDVTLQQQPFDVVLHSQALWAAFPCDDSTVRIIDIKKGKQVKILKLHKEWPRRIEVSCDGTRLVTADERGGAILWDTSNWSVVRRFKCSADEAAFDESGTRIVTALRHPDDDDVPASQVATIWDARDGQVLKKIHAPGWLIRGAVLSPDGKQIACALERCSDIEQQKAVLFDLSSGKTLAELAADFESINDFVFLPDKKTIATAVYGLHRKPILLWTVNES